MILIDLQKTFHTLNHEISKEKKKVEGVGFKKPAINCCVSIERVFSEEGLLKCGVLQGSILGPLLFVIYINDLPQSLSESASNFYANDTCIYYQHRNIQNIENVLNKRILIPLEMVHQ